VSLCPCTLTEDSAYLEVSALVTLCSSDVVPSCDWAPRSIGPLFLCVCVHLCVVCPLTLSVVLNLARNEMEADGVSQIAIALEANSTLLELNVSSNMIQSPGCVSVCVILCCALLFSAFVP
jgi:hypothetical protein